MTNLKIRELQILLQMDISARFNQEALSDVVLHVRSTSDDHARNDPDSRKRASSEDGPASERSFYLHKVLLFQSPYFEKLHGWRAGCAAAPSQASSGPCILPPSEVPAGHAEQTVLDSTAFASSGRHAPPPPLPGAAEELDRASAGPSIPPPSGEPVDALAELHVRPLPGKTAELLEPAAAPSAACAALPTVCAASAARAEQVVPAGAVCAACAARAVELVINVEECELEAVELLLKCLYKVELTEEARGNGQLLLRVYCLEDKYKIPAACMEPTLAALSALQAKSIDLALLSQVYSLPTQLSEAPSLQRLAAVCKQKLLELFGDVPAVITDLEQRRQFCALPYAAVLAWLQSDDLKVHSESCVLLLLTAWVNSEEHPACNIHQLKQLAHSVRVEHLSAMYLHGVLPDLEWFREGCSESFRYLRGMHLQKAVDGDHTGWEEPAAWIAPKRSKMSMPASATINWSLGPEELGQLNTSTTCLRIHSPGSAHLGSAYLHGIFFKLGADREEVEGVITLGMFLAVHSRVMETMLGFWDSLENPCLFNAEMWVAGQLEGEIINVACHGLSFGFPDVLGRSAATFSELVAPLLVGGRLSLKAVIKAA